MEKVITLEDILHLYGPEEPISLSMVLSPEIKLDIYKGLVKDAPLRNYKDKEVRSIKTFFVEDAIEKDVSPELQEEDCQEERYTYIELNNTEPEEGFHVFRFEYGLTRVLRNVRVVDVKTANIVYEGLAKEIPTDLANSLWHKAAVFCNYVPAKKYGMIYTIFVE